MVDAAARGEIDVFWIVGGNFLETLPDPAAARARRSRRVAHCASTRTSCCHSTMLVEPTDTCCSCRPRRATSRPAAAPRPRPSAASSSRPRFPAGASARRKPSGRSSARSPRASRPERARRGPLRERAGHPRRDRAGGAALRRASRRCARRATRSSGAGARCSPTAASRRPTARRTSRAVDRDRRGASRPGAFLRLDAARQAVQLDGAARGRPADRRRARRRADVAPRMPTRLRPRATATRVRLRSPRGSFDGRVQHRADQAGQPRGALAGRQRAALARRDRPGIAASPTTTRWSHWKSCPEARRIPGVYSHARSAILRTTLLAAILLFSRRRCRGWTGRSCSASGARAAMEATRGEAGRGPGWRGIRGSAGSRWSSCAAMVQRGFPNSGMPAFDLPPEELDAVAGYVRSLNAGVTVGPPAGKRVTWGKPRAGRLAHLQRER